MFKYNSEANYQPNEGCYLQVLSGKDLYKQTIEEIRKGMFWCKLPLFDHFCGTPTLMV